MADIEGTYSETNPSFQRRQVDDVTYGKESMLVIRQTQSTEYNRFGYINFK